MHGSEAIAGGVWEEVARLGSGGGNGEQIAAQTGAQSGAQIGTRASAAVHGDGPLIAIVSKPSRGEAAVVDPARPIVILLNAGVLHRVGPHRLHVTLARQLARRGFLAVRLDLGGLGDSPATAMAGSFTESAVADVRAAMTDLAQRFGARRFVLFGLCSGADNGFAAALEDERIAGLVLLDPHSYRTRRSALRKLGARAAAMGNPVTVAWWGASLAARVVRQQAVTRLAQLRARLAGASGGEAGEPSGGREAPPVHVFREQLTRIVDRGVKVLAIYSGAYGDRYNHRDQLFELFPELRGRVDHEFFPAANHMFTELAEQTTLITVVSTWLVRHFAA